MSKDKTEFQIEWGLHEFGPRQAPQLHVAHGPKDPSRLAFVLALAHGEVPANAPVIDEGQAA